jgi:predicted enzyme related to lactoylglutathione lyase
VVAVIGLGHTSFLAAADRQEPGRFVWRDLMTRDVSAARRFYGELLGWQFEDTRRGDRPYVLASVDDARVAGIVDISSVSEAGSQWLSYMSVADVDKTVDLVKAEGGKVLVEPRNMPLARVAVVTDPQGAPVGLAQLRREMPDPVQPAPRQFLQALAFYKRLAGYESTVLESRQEIDYHVLRTTRGRAGLFRLPPTVVDVEPNWLPYVLVDDPSAVAARVPGLGGRIVVPAAPERRKGTVVVIADPGGAVLALQKYPF